MYFEYFQIYERLKQLSKLENSKQCVYFLIYERIKQLWKLETGKKQFVFLDLRENKVIVENGKQWRDIFREIISEEFKRQSLIPNSSINLSNNI